MHATVRGPRSEQLGSDRGSSAGNAAGILDRNGRRRSPRLTDRLDRGSHPLPRRRGRTAAWRWRARWARFPELLRGFSSVPGYLFVKRGCPGGGGCRQRLKLKGVYVKLEQRRDDPLGPQRRGHRRTNLDNVGIEGLELQYEDELRGLAGWTTRIRDRAGRVSGSIAASDAAPRTISRSSPRSTPICSLFSNRICRARWTRCARCGALGLFSIAHRRDPGLRQCAPSAAGEGAQLELTDQFEPGSDVQVVVAGASLEDHGGARSVVRSRSVRSGFGGRPAPCFHDTTARPGTVPGRGALVEQYRHGQARTACRGAAALPLAVDLASVGSPASSSRARPAASCAAPSHGSARSTPTIAIGHELSVTPLRSRWRTRRSRTAACFDAFRCWCARS